MAAVNTFLTPWPMFEIGENPTIIQATELPMMAALPSFDIRNGDPSDAKSLLVKATIPVGYHWVPVSGVTPNTAMSSMEGFIRSQTEQLAAHPPIGMGAAQIRKAGICLGVARAVATNLFSVTAQDLIPGETANPKLATGNVVNGNPTYVANPTLPDAEKTRLAVPLALTDLEKAAIAALVMSSIGLIPLQGYSLMMTQHHYLSAENTQSRKAYAVVEKQFWKSSDVAQWFNDDLAVIQDSLWHKACHPVNMTLKSSAAVSVKVAAMVREAGAGSAASRLPALEPEVRAANSYKTLMATVAPMYQICAGSVAYDLLDVAIETVKAFPVGVPNPVMPQGLDARVPNTVIDRSTARLWLSGVLNRNSDKAAHCYGFYCALTDQSQMMGTSAGTESLKTSNSLSKLQNQSHAAFVAGQQFYADYQSVRVKMREDGRIAAPQFVVE